MLTYTDYENDDLFDDLFDEFAADGYDWEGDYEAFDAFGDDPFDALSGDLLDDGFDEEDWFYGGDLIDAEVDPYGDYEGSPNAEAVFAEMQRYADLAASAESESEADEFLGAAVRLVPSLIRASAPIVKRLGRAAIQTGARVAKAGARAVVAAGRRLVPKVATLIRTALARVRAIVKARKPGAFRRFLSLIPRIVARAASALSRLGPRITLNAAVRIVQQITFNMLNVNVAINTGGGGRRPSGGGTTRRRRPRSRGRKIVRPKYCVL